jgi:Uma2 family endonuclease
MQAVTRKLYTEEEYWALEETAPIKHEYWNGEIFAMSGGTANHSLITVRISAAFTTQLRGKACRAFGSDLRVKICRSSKRFNTYPDISIACPPLHFEEKRSGVKDTLLNPRVIVEVLSPSTEKHDRTTKFDEYKLIESLTDYILVEQERIRVEHYHRTENGKWMVESYINREDSFSLPGLEIMLSLAEIYEEIDLSADLRLVKELSEDTEA